MCRKQALGAVKINFPPGFSSLVNSVIVSIGNGMCSNTSVQSTASKQSSDSSMVQISPL